MSWSSNAFQALCFANRFQTRLIRHDISNIYAERLCVHPHGLTSDSSHIWWRVPGGLQFLIHYTLTASLLKNVFCSLTLHATRNWHNPCSYEVGRYGNYHAGGYLSIPGGRKLVHIQQTILGDSLQVSQEIPEESGPHCPQRQPTRKYILVLAFSPSLFYSFQILTSTPPGIILVLRTAFKKTQVKIYIKGNPIYFGK